MRIQTEKGKLEAMAWHVGRHVSITAGEFYFRVDGQPVADFYAALQRQQLSFVEVEGRELYNIQIDTREEGCILTINLAPPIVLTSEGHMELLAVFETAFTQDTKGLTELSEDRERRRYGLPPVE